VSCVTQAPKKDIEEHKSTEATELEVKVDGPFTKYDPPIVVTACRVHTPTELETLSMLNETEQDNRWYKYYEDELGIKVKLLWSAPDTDTFNTKLGLAVSSREVPDIMFLRGSAKTVPQFANAGVFADLTDVIENYPYNVVKEAFKEAGKEAFGPVMVNGRIYAVPRIYGGEQNISSLLWLRKDWLDILGLEPPKTIDELDVIMDAFVNKDPDGNNIKDTLALAAYLNAKSSMMGLIHGFHAYPGIWLEGKDGKLSYGSVTDTMKEAIAKIREYYMKGYIPKEFNTIDYATGRQMLVQGKIGSVAAGQAGFGLYDMDAAYTFNNNINWVPYPMPTSDGKPVVGVGIRNSNFFTAVSSSCKHPEAIIKMLNLFVKTLWDPEHADEELFNRYSMPPEIGREITFLSLAQYELMGKNWKKCLACKHAYETGDKSVLFIPEFQYMYDALIDWYEKGVRDHYSFIKIFGFEDSSNLVIYDHFIKNNLVIVNKFQGIPTPTMAQIQVALDTMENETIHQIIIGEKPIDYFDTFVKNWYDQGGKAITEEVNAWYQTNK
jgi:putative aldouronate transport system substrate-binding protein